MRTLFAIGFAYNLKLQIQKSERLDANLTSKNEPGGTAKHEQSWIFSDQHRKCWHFGFCFWSSCSGRRWVCCPEGLEAQTKQVIANLTEALKALEASPQNIVQMRIYVTDLNEDAMNILMPPIIAFLNGAEPSLTGIGVAALAGPDLKVEIEMIVQLPT